MAQRHKRPCKKCKKQLTRNAHGYRDGCEGEYREKVNARHKNYNANGRDADRQKLYGGPWPKASKAYLADNPWCVECDILTLATVTDHIIPHCGDLELFWDETNWQSLCKNHHDRKTARGE